MFLKFLGLCFIHLQGILFSSDDYNAHRHNLSKKSISRKKALCMAYWQNNKKIKKERDVKIIKHNMKLKLELVQEQLSGTKFEQIAGVGIGVRESAAAQQKYQMRDSDYSLDSEEALAPAPFLRKGVSSYDPEIVKKEEKEFEKKRLELEKNEKDLEMFQDFNEIEQQELAKLDNLTKIYLFLRRNITNPIIS